MEQIKTIKCIFQLPRDLGDQTFQRSSRCPAIITMTPPLLPPMHHVQQGGRPQLYEDLGDAEQLIQSPSEPWPSGLPAPWLGEGIYQLPLDNNLEWVQQQQQQQLQRQQQQQQQRQNLLRFSSSSANSDDATKRSCRRPDDVAPKRPKASLKVAERRKSPTSIRTKLFDRPLWSEVTKSNICSSPFTWKLKTPATRRTAAARPPAATTRTTWSAIVKCLKTQAVTLTRRL